MEYLILSYCVGAIALILVILAAKGHFEDFKRPFFVLWFLGIAMSAFAAFRDHPSGPPDEWLPIPVFWPLSILGALAFVLLFAMLTRRYTNYRKAFILLTIIIASKWVIVHLFKLILALQGIVP
jgi:peptidoglycan/LPS O-acetylase OafA/YrhL